MLSSTRTHTCMHTTQHTHHKHTNIVYVNLGVQDLSQHVLQYMCSSTVCTSNAELLATACATRRICVSISLGKEAHLVAAQYQKRTHHLKHWTTQLLSLPKADTNTQVSILTYTRHYCTDSRFLNVLLLYTLEMCSVSTNGERAGPAQLCFQLIGCHFSYNT